MSSPGHQRPAQADDFPMQRQQRSCLWCNTEAVQLQRCAQCKAAWFCDRLCQKVPLRSTHMSLICVLLVQRAWEHHKQQCQRPVYPSVTAVLCTDLAELIYSLLFHMHQAPMWSLASAAAGPRAAAERFAENQLLKLLGAGATVRLGGPSWLVLLRVLYAEQLWCVSNGILLRLQTDSDGCGCELVDDCPPPNGAADGWNQAGGAWCAGAFYTVHNDGSLRAFSAVSLQWQQVAIH